MTADVYALSGPGLPQSGQSYVVVPTGASVANLDPEVFSGLSWISHSSHFLTPGQPVLGMSATHIIQDISRQGFHLHRGQAAKK